jgi:hypothetical protein
MIVLIELIVYLSFFLPFLLIILSFKKPKYNVNDIKSYLSSDEWQSLEPIDKLILFYDRIKKDPLKIVGNKTSLIIKSNVDYDDFAYFGTNFKIYNKNKLSIHPYFVFKLNLDCAIFGSKKDSIEQITKFKNRSHKTRQQINLELIKLFEDGE